MSANLENNVSCRSDQAPLGGNKPIDIWDGRPPEIERLRNAFAPFAHDPKKLTIIYEFLELGRQIHDESLETGRPTPEAFEALIDRYTQDNDAQFLFEDHPVLAAKNLAVIRWAAGLLVGKDRQIGFRQADHEVRGLSGRRN